MKKVILVLINILAAVNLLEAQSVYIPGGSSGIGNSSNSSVGIGILSPLSKLHVLGDLRLDASIPLPLNAINNDPNNYSNNFILRLASSNNGLFFSTSNITNARKSYIQSGHSGSSFSAATGFLGLNPFGGNVGIGTGEPYPFAQLDIMGPYAPNRHSAQLHLHTTNNLTGMFLGSYESKLGWISVGAHINNSGNLLAVSDQFNGIQMINGRIRFYSESNLTSGAIFSSIPKMTIDVTGNVGIGTTNPGTYKLAVNGSIKAKEVEVTLSGWPDYVFDAQYNLMPLNEVAAFIAKNQHLPEVPSAQEVASNGINLGEMDKVLLKKIEEMTLYILQQENRIKSLEQKLDQLTQNEK